MADYSELPDDLELTVDEAVQELRSWGYENMTDRGLWLMVKLGGGFPLRSRPALDGSEYFFVLKSEILEWMQKEHRVGAEQRRIAEEEQRLQSLRTHPVCVVIFLEDGPWISRLRDQIEAYECKAVSIDDLDAADEYFDGVKPDAAVIFVEQFDKKEISRTIEDIVKRGIYCVLVGDQSGLVLSEETRSRCVKYKGLAYGNAASAFSIAPSQLALRMNLHKGLKFEHDLYLERLTEFL